MSFDKYIHSCNHHHNHRVFLLSQKVPWCSFAINLLLCSWPQATTNQPSVTIAFAGSKSSYKLNHMVFTLLYLAPLSPHNGFEINSGSLSIYIVHSFSLLSSIPQDRCTMVHLTIQPLKDICIVSSLGLLINVL